MYRRSYYNKVLVCKKPSTISFLHKLLVKMNNYNKYREEALMFSIAHFGYLETCKFVWSSIMTVIHNVWLSKHEMGNCQKVNLRQIPRIFKNIIFFSKYAEDRFAFLQDMWKSAWVQIRIHVTLIFFWSARNIMLQNWIWSKLTKSRFHFFRLPNIHHVPRYSN